MFNLQNLTTMENTKNQNQQIDFTSVNNELQAFHKLLDDAERKTQEQERRVDAILRSRQRG